MSRNLFGQLENEKPIDRAKYVPITAKRCKLQELKSRPPLATKAEVKLCIKNSLLTQTIEVMKQTEMLQSLIDTYSNKSGPSSYPSQMIPEIDFPPENSTDLVKEDKFTKPIWFLPPLSTEFTRGEKQEYAKLDLNACHAGIRKGACGQMRLSGFTDASESSILLFTDVVEYFIRNLMQEIKSIKEANPQQALNTSVDAVTAEKAYAAATSSSLTQVHSHLKHNLVARNRAEIAEFNSVLQEYNKLRKDSQNVQKEEYQDDFMSMLDVNHLSNEPKMPVSAGAVDIAGTRGLMLQHQTSVDAFSNSSLTPSYVMHDEAEGVSYYTTRQT